ncbi:hypothetical protein [Embleya sp. NBC_00896]|uniref:hypothetical protein n=1 Tax=Embleya sp. NBC_00896 TaxID=2975961 RepID=UPI002F90FA4A|nr:hypothetical protein OG928_47925 [Embleya sp. NBC_00896]
MGDRSVHAVVFDHKAVFRTDTREPHEGIADLLEWLDGEGIRWVLLTTHPFDGPDHSARCGLPAPALHLAQDDIPDRKKRGNAAWLTTAAQRLGLRTNQLLMVGASQFDWYTSIHAGVMHVHAKWPQALYSGITSLTADRPDGVRGLVERHLLEEPVWAFELDAPERGFRLRSLLLPDTVLPSSPGTTFTLKDIFTYGRTVLVGDQDARGILLLRLLSSAYLDGSLPGSSLFCVYPSSSPGRVNAQLETYLEKAKVIVGARYDTRDHLLVRASRAVDTSLERVNAKQQGRTPNVSIANQTHTVHVNPKHRRKVRGKTVVVFDDFTTDGTSVDWARLLLTEAGADRVIALTVGKYRKPHTFHTPRPGVAIDPYGPNTLGVDAFTTTSSSPGFGSGPADSLRNAFTKIIASGTHIAPH